MFPKFLSHRVWILQWLEKNKPLVQMISLCIVFKIRLYIKELENDDERRTQHRMSPIRKRRE